MALPPFSDAPNCSLPTGPIVPDIARETFEGYEASKARYFAALAETHRLSDPDLDKAAQAADDTALRAAHRAGKPLPRPEQTDTLAADRRLAAAEEAAASDDVLARWHGLRAVAEAAVPEGLPAAIAQARAARAALDSLIEQIPQANLAWRRALALVGFWRAVHEGRGLNYNDSGIGSFCVGNSVLLPLDVSGELRRMRDEGVQAEEMILKLLAMAAEPAA